MVKIWKADHESWLQALHFIYALGLLVAHWLLEPYFKNLVHGSNGKITIEAVKLEDLPNTDYLFVIENVDVTRTKNEIDIDVEATLIQRERINNIGEPKIVNFAVDNEFVLASVPTFLIAFGLLILAFYVFMRKKAKNVHFSNEEVASLKEKAGESDDYEKVPTFVIVFLWVFLFLFFLTLSWLQLSAGEYIFGLSFHELNFSGHHAKIVSLIYWGSFVFGTFLGIFVIKCFTAKTFIIISIVLLANTFLPWCFIARCHGLIWLVATFLGLSTSTLFATGLSWTYEHFSLTRGLGTFAMLGRTMGAMLGPVTIDLVLKSFGFKCFLSISAGIVILLTFLFILMHFTSKKYGRFSQRNLVLSILPDPVQSNKDDDRPKWLHEAAY